MSRIFVYRLRAAALLGAVAFALLVLPSQAQTSGRAEIARAGEPEITSARAADEVRRGIRGCANRRRIKHGLRPLELSEPLEKAAGLHATLMRKKHFFGHVDPSGRDVVDRVAIFASSSKFEPIGENLGAGFGSARKVCKEWMNSPGHRANLLNPDYTVTGSGFARGGDYGTYFVQVFGRK